MTRGGILFILILEIFNLFGIDRMRGGFMVCQTKIEYCIIGASRDFSFIRTSRAKPRYIVKSVWAVRRAS